MAEQSTGNLCITISDPAATSPDVWQLVAQAWPLEERAGHMHAIADVIQRGEGRSLLLLVAHQSGRLRGACFTQLLAGRSAVVAMPQTTSSDPGERAHLSDRLLSQLETELQAAGMHLAQVLLPYQDSAGSAVLAQAGFSHSSDLLYLFCTPESYPDAPLPLPFELTTWNPAEESRLIRIVDETYVGSLDCPQIDGLRATADVLRGYRTTGELRPELWQIVRHNHTDVGCLILALHPAGPHLELVYLGLVPAVRGQGWGLDLTGHALWLARQAGAQRVVLAVDATNEPAVRMYVAAGFSAWDRRQLWIKPVGIPK